MLITLWPPTVVTVTSTTPTPAGAVAVIPVPAGLTSNAFAGMPPNLTAKAPVKLEPVMTVTVPPSSGPLRGFRRLIAGADPTGVYVKWSAEVASLGPSGVPTVTSTVPAPIGAWAVIVVLEWTSKLVASRSPNSTDVAVLRWVPVIVTTVPPVPGPSEGSTFVTVGATALPLGVPSPVGPS